MPRFTDALNAGLIFAPFTLRLSMRLEQARWEEVTESSGEAVFLIRSGQRLFGLDAVCAWFDTWLEAEAAGVQIERGRSRSSHRCAYSAILTSIIAVASFA